MRDKVVLLLAALGVKDIVDALLSTALQAVEQEIVNRAAGQYLQLAQATGQLTDFDFSGAVQSIKEGDTTVTFLDGATDVETFGSMAAALAQYGENQFNRYRRLIW